MKENLVSIEFLNPILGWISGTQPITISSLFSKKNFLVRKIIRNFAAVIQLTKKSNKIQQVCGFIFINIKLGSGYGLVLGWTQFVGSEFGIFGRFIVRFC